jgi:hypothetical protein
VSREKFYNSIPYILFIAFSLYFFVSVSNDFSEINKSNKVYNGLNSDLVDNVYFYRGGEREFSVIYKAGDPVVEMLTIPGGGVENGFYKNTGNEDCFVDIVSDGMIMTFGVTLFLDEQRIGLFMMLPNNGRPDVIRNRNPEDHYISTDSELFEFIKARNIFGLDYDINTPKSNGIRLPPCIDRVSQGIDVSNSVSL